SAGVRRQPPRRSPRPGRARPPPRARTTSLEPLDDVPAVRAARRVELAHADPSGRQRERQVAEAGHHSLPRVLVTSLRTHIPVVRRVDPWVLVVLSLARPLQEPPGQLARLALRPRDRLARDL